MQAFKVTWHENDIEYGEHGSYPVYIPQQTSDKTRFTLKEALQFVEYLESEFDFVSNIKIERIK